MPTEINFNDDMIVEKVKKVLFKSVVKMQELAMLYAPVDTGRLRSSIRISPTQPGSQLYTLTAGTEYAAAIEYGTNPHFTSYKNLTGWSNRVLGDEKAAFAIRAAIAKRGTDAQPFMRPALDQVKRVWIPRYMKIEFTR